MFCAFRVELSLSLEQCVCIFALGWRQKKSPLHSSVSSVAHLSQSLLLTLSGSLSLSGPLLNQPKLCLTPFWLYVTTIFSKHRLSSKSIIGTPRKSVRGYLYRVEPGIWTRFYFNLIVIGVWSDTHWQGKALFVKAKDQKNWKKMTFICFAFTIGSFLACKEADCWTPWHDSAL